MKIIEKRIMGYFALAALCNRKGWYTEGNKEEYGKLLDLLVDEKGNPANMTTEKLAEIAENILAHSNKPIPKITDVMYELEKNCVVTFEEVCYHASSTDKIGNIEFPKAERRKSV
jgi:hypothetical protein